MPSTAGVGTSAVNLRNILGIRSAFLPERQFLGKDPSRESYWERFWNFFTKTTVESNEISAGLDGVGIKANLKQDPSFKAKLQEQMQGHLGALVADVRSYLESCVKALKKVHGQDTRVVLILDSIEQIRGTSVNEKEVYASVETLFQGHPDKLRLPYIHAVYTPFGQTEERPWKKAWESFLLRANERREQFRARFSNGLVIAAPDELKPLFREAAPDLWSVRSLSLDLDSPIFPKSSIEQRFIDIRMPEEQSAPDPELALQEAQRLEEQRPDAHLAIGQAYLRAAEGLYTKGEHVRALNAAQKATCVFRRLSANHRDISLSYLAIALNNLGIVLNALGEGKAALEATREAVEINRELSVSRPDTFLPELTKSLHNLGIWLSDLGQREESLRAIQEAVDIRRKLSAASPDAFLPDLAMSLLNLGMRLRELGQQNESLMVTREAVEIFRRLSAAHPEFFFPDLAMSLNNLGVRLSELGHAEEAFAAEEEALRILTTVFVKSPGAFADWMSILVNNYRASAKAAGREVDMDLLAPIQEKPADLSSEAM